MKLKTSILLVLALHFLPNTYAQNIPQHKIETQSGKKDSNGNRTGFYKYYTADGTLVATRNWLNDKPHGEANYFWKNGSVYRKSKYENSIIKESNNFSETSHGTRKEGVFSNFYESGKIKETGQYLNDHSIGIWKTFDEDGTVLETKNYGTKDKDYYSEQQLIEMRKKMLGQ